MPIVSGGFNLVSIGFDQSITAVILSYLLIFGKCSHCSSNLTEFAFPLFLAFFFILSRITVNETTTLPWSTKLPYDIVLRNTNLYDIIVNLTFGFISFTLISPSFREILIVSGYDCYCSNR